MKKQNYIKVWKIIAFLLALPCLTNGQISKVIFFDKAAIESKTLKKMGKDYEQLDMKMAFRSDDVGKPDLPVYYKTFYVPKGQVVTAVNFTHKKQQEMQLTYDLIPTQHRVPSKFSGIDTLFDEPDAKVYALDAFYPEKQAEIYNTDFFDGDLQIVTVEVYPIQYHPRQKKLKLSIDGEISLITSSASTVNSVLSNTLIVKNHDRETIDMLKSMVENPLDVSIAEAPNSQSVSLKSALTTWTVPYYEYVIVTSRTLKQAFSEFVEWKKRKGYNAGIVCIEDILADPSATGDAVSNLNDSAGKLRQYLNAGYSAGITKYTLLGGDYSVVPIRYGCGYDNSWDYVTPVDTAVDAQKIPSDLYFSDFNGNWNVDGDIYTGEKNGDAVDYAPEIYVGRIICNSVLDIKNWTAKAIKYEKNPGNGDYTYLSKWLASQADQLRYYLQAEYIRKYLPTIFTTKTIFNELPSYNSEWPTFPKGADVIAELNQHYGLYSNFNHGGPLGYGTATHSDYYGTPIFGHDVHSNVVSVDAYDLNDNYPGMYSARPESNNGFDNLTNTDYPTIIYSISCDNMPFDDYGAPTECRNLAEAFMCMNSSGGPAYLGNTRYGWVDYSTYLYRDFLVQLSTSNSLGKAEGLSKSTFSNHWLKLSHNLAGCPEMPMWTASPTLFNGTISENGTSITVNTGGAVAKICVMSALNDGYFQIQPASSSYTFTGVSKPYYVTITKSNYIPYQNVLTNVYIQNKNLSSTAYLNVQTVSAGYNVDANQTVGNVVIQNGADITFDATGDIILAAGFEVQVGAIFEAK
jgi:hypothetical protein